MSLDRSLDVSLDRSLGLSKSPSLSLDLSLGLSPSLTHGLVFRVHFADVILVRGLVLLVLIESSDQLLVLLHQKLIVIYCLLQFILQAQDFGSLIPRRVHRRD